MNEVTSGLTRALRGFLREHGQRRFHREACLQCSVARAAILRAEQPTVTDAERAIHELEVMLMERDGGVS